MNYLKNVRHTHEVGDLQNKFLLSLDEVAAMLHMTKRTVYKYRAAGMLKEIRIGRKILFKKTDLEEFLEGRRTESAHENTQTLGGLGHG